MSDYHDEPTYEEVQEENQRNGIVWCDNCCEWVSIRTLKRWTGDDRLHWLCPGCDDDLLPVERLPQ